MIELEGVEKSFSGGVRALRDLTFTVDRGEFVFLTGPSGAGKSTLLSLLTLRTRPSRGRVRLEGVDLGRLARSQVPMLRRRIGVVYQDFRLMHDRSVYENVALPLRVLGLPEPEIRRETREALKRCGLVGKEGLNPRRLSGGEQQRVAVARALAHDPGLILADEPTGNLDAETGWEIVRLLMSAHERGATVLVATHNPALLNALPMRRLALNRGGLESDVRPAPAEEAS